MTAQQQATVGGAGDRGVPGIKSGKTPGVREVPSPGPGELPQTPYEIEGPYFRLGAPRRSNLLEPGDQPGIIVSGRVLNPKGTPAVSRPVTTQLFIEGEARNLDDAYYNPALLVACTVDEKGVRHGTFDFVIAQFTADNNVTPETLAARV